MYDYHNIGNKDVVSAPPSNYSVYLGLIHLRSRRNRHANDHATIMALTVLSPRTPFAMQNDIWLQLQTNTTTNVYMNYTFYTNMKAPSQIVEPKMTMPWKIERTAK